MGDFSGTGAIGAGFRLIGREPQAFLVWIVSFLLLGVLPQVGFLAAILPQWSRMMQEIAASGPAHARLTSLDMFRAQAGMMQLQPLVWLMSLFSRTLVLSAIYRAVLEPEDRGFFYLRLGMRELWLGLTMLVLIVVAILLTIVAMVPTMILVGFIAALAHEAPGVQLVILPVTFLALGVIVWVLLRLSMATPMSFAQRGFRLYESWDLTRGQAGKMFFVALAFVLMAIGFEVVVGCLGLVALGGFAGVEHLSGWVLQPKFDLARVMPWVVGAGVAASIVATAIITLFGAGWAEIYRELTEGQTAAWGLSGPKA
jgi:hypothetical protein